MFLARGDQFACPCARFASTRSVRFGPRFLARDPNFVREQSGRSELSDASCLRARIPMAAEGAACYILSNRVYLRTPMTLNPDSKPAKKQGRIPGFDFLTSAADLGGCPSDWVPEIALAGRSNAGKSSFINALANSKIARVSSTPGKTTLLNFYQSSSGYRLVDMPGYGYAKRGGDQRDGWASMIEPYLAARGNLAGALILLDVRRPWSDEETLLARWLRPLGLPAAAVLTKADKVSRSEAASALARAQRDSGLERAFVTSALKKTGFAELEDFVYGAWAKPRLRAGGGS